MHRVYILVAAACLLPSGARADYVTEHYGTTGPSDSWRYSFLDGAGHAGDIVYSPSLADLNAAAFLGYVAPDSAGLWSAPGKGPTVPTSEVYVFETFVVSDVDRSIPLVVGGDDGHAIFLDGLSAGEGGFHVDVPFTLALSAGVPRRLTVAVHNGIGPMVVGLWRQDAPQLGLQSIDGLHFEAPEPATPAFAISGGLACAVWRLRRRPARSGQACAAAAALAMLLWQGLPSTGLAEPPFVSAEGNFWRVPDLAQITGSSPGHPCSNCELTNMFQNESWGPKTSIFADGGEAGALHWVEWETNQPFFLTSFNLLALHDTPGRDANYRGFSAFRLYARPSAAAEWNQLYELHPVSPYQFTTGPDVIPSSEWGYLAVHADVARTLARQFRAEFVQFGSIPHAAGPRVQALHGFGLAPTAGDADLDGDVDLGDFGLLKANFAQPGKGWAEGDFNGNSVPDLEDFGLLKANFGRGTAGGAAAVPEPAAWSLLLAGLVLCGCRCAMERRSIS